MSNSRTTLGPGDFYRDANPSSFVSRSIADQLMQVDSAITATLQEIDANFARAHQVVTAKLLPAVKLYGQNSAKTWQSAKFWQEFFITAAHIPGKQTDEEGGDVGGLEVGTEANDEFAMNSSSAKTKYHAADGSLENTRDEQRAPEDNHLDAGYDSSNDSARFFQSVKNARASSPPRLSKNSRSEVDRHEQENAFKVTEAGEDSQASWANVESPFERLKREVQAEQEACLSHQAETVLRRHRVARRHAFHADSSGQDLSPESSRLRVKNSYSSVGPQSPAKLRAGAGTSRLLNKVLSAEQHKADAANRRKPGSEKSAVNLVRQDLDYASSAHSGESRWNGIADLRSTPIAGKGPHSRKEISKSHGKGKASGVFKGKDLADIDSDDDSLAWPEGMSPPVTMQFSVPHSKYAKTPAKEAAKLLVEDLLRTAEAGPSTVRRERERKVGTVAGLTSSKRTVTTQDSSRPKPQPMSPSLMRQGSAAVTPLRQGSRKLEKQGAHPAAGAQKRRGSMPTPPTLTRHVITTGPSKVTPASLQRSDLLPGSAGSSSGKNGSAVPGGRAALLLDEGEGGSAGDDDDNNNNNDLPAIEGAAPLRSGVLGHASKKQTNLNMLLDQDLLLDVANDEESESESESEDEDEDSDDIGLLASREQSGLPDNVSQLSSFTRTTKISWPGLSQSRLVEGASLDNDTLFGVGKSNPGRAGIGEAGTSAIQATGDVVSSRDKVTDGLGRSAGDGRPREFRVVGQLEDTVQGGKLLEDKDLTYSAPSPTPWK